jgi:ATPase family associated with various cellular activities (AAA)
MTWREANGAWLCLALDRLRLRLQRRALWLEHREPAALDADWLLGADIGEREFLAQHGECRALQEAIDALGSRLDADAACLRSETAAPALRQLSHLCGLSAFEEELLLLAAAPALDASFERLYAALQRDPHRPYPTLQLGLGLLLDTMEGRFLAVDALLPSGSLRRFQLLEMQGDGVGLEPVPARALHVPDRVTDYLRGVNRVDERVRVHVRAAPRPLLTTPHLSMVDTIAERLASAEQWPVINLVGGGDAGCIDVAAAACARRGLRLFVVEPVELMALPASEREEFVARLTREARLGAFAVLVDTDAAAMDEAPHRLRSLVHHLMERLASVLFVVSRDCWQTDQPVVVVSVARPDRAAQTRLWHLALGDVRHSVNGEVAELTQQFDLGPPAISSAVRRAQELAHAREGAESAVLASDLWAACRERGGQTIGDLARRVTSQFVWDDIVLPPDSLAQLRELASQVERRSAVYDEWGFGRQLGRGRGITALFAGASGTGKTMAAEIIAGHLGLELYRIDLSGITSRFVGESEKNLRRVFDAAERTGAILFFDEADSLFGSRAEVVRDSHDRYSNLEVNYLLQRMEDYTGLAILSTNRRQSLDSAFLRRLRFVIDFPFPSDIERRCIWERVFPPEAQRDGLDFAALSRLEIPGGHIRSIAVNAAFLAAGERKPIGMGHVMRATRREYAKLDKPLLTAGLSGASGRPAS